MARITIGEELESELRRIQDTEESLRKERGLDSTVSFVVREYDRLKSVETQLEEFRVGILESMRSEVQEGVSEAMRQILTNIMSLKKN